MEIKDIPADMFGRRFHIDDFELEQKPSRIKRGDLVFSKDIQAYKSGHLVVANQEFENTSNYGFTFISNNNYKGICNRNEWICSFAYRIKAIKKLEPLIPTFCQVIDIKENQVTVESENKRRFLIQYPSKVYGTIGNVIWGYVNDVCSDFAAYDTNAPINSIELK